jgi:hypothetical protein
MSCRALSSTCGRGARISEFDVVVVEDQTPDVTLAATRVWQAGQTVQ